MNFAKVIEVDIWSSFGCFTKPFSTSGGLLSYLIPPKTTIIGMIGSVLGFDVTSNNNEIFEFLMEDLYNIKISIQPLFNFKSKRITFNQSSIVNKKIKINNIKQDVLLNPYYKLFISFPDYLSDIEEIFIQKLENNESVYSLYMGKNEFLLEYSLRNIFEYESILLNKNNIKGANENLKIYGILNRELVRDVKIAKISENELSFILGPDIQELPEYYEYIINEYPVCRLNFTDFVYQSISFYFSKNFKDCYFYDVTFKDGVEDDLELTKIGDNEWICMI